MICFGNVPAGSVLPVIFDSFAGGTGASITLTGLAVTDIEVYKGTSMTQRASDNGYALIDTDGIDLDGITGIHGFSIDTSDNSDAGFYAAGSFYTVVVSSVTIDSQTVSFVAATFRLVAAESAAGTPKADVSMFGGSAGAFAGGRPEVNTTHAAGTAWGSGAITAAAIDAGALNGKGDWNIGKTGYALSGAGVLAIWDAATTALTTAGSIGKFLLDRIDVVLSSRLAAAGYTAPLDAAGTRAALGMAGANLDAQIAALAAFVDTEVAAIKAVTDQLPNGGSLSSLATSAQIAALNDLSVADIIAGISDGTFDFQEMTRIIFAACAGLSSQHELGTPKYRDAADTKNRISATTDVNGNRTAIVLDGS
ncbi:MAG: hypothetical protein K2Y51_13715 [Gammaproteobacteria bacterium]|nr:hypothetical protein [Gammaproteobacteria bacterium]